ncbi:unnamed protein product [Pleuronectes platessa]|uniref:Uncharacterized protein n=1 Tax=Pleuronectes platessa TaxID=8262 RepID=A0A9N7TU91_PLEPL|nr:unnamed protein product [Pleuronectes platessa]
MEAQTGRCRLGLASNLAAKQGRLEEMTPSQLLNYNKSWCALQSVHTSPVSCVTLNWCQEPQRSSASTSPAGPQHFQDVLLVTAKNELHVMAISFIHSFSSALWPLKILVLHAPCDQGCFLDGPHASCTCLAFMREGGTREGVGGRVGLSEAISGAVTFPDGFEPCQLCASLSSERKKGNEQEKAQKAEHAD